MVAPDPRLIAADDWHRKHVWLETQLDDLTRQSRYAREMEERLRAQVRDEIVTAAEVRALQAAADRELERRAGRKARAT